MESLQQKQKEDEIKEQTQLFSIDFVRRADRHNIPARATKCLVKCLKKHLSSENCKDVVQNLKLGTTKIGYTAKYGVAKTYTEETIRKLKSSDAFSIGFDESEINKNNECEVMINISDKDNGIELRHYKSLSLDETDAGCIVETITEELDDDGVHDWKEKLVAVMTDGCNTMIGCHSGVQKRLQAVVPQLKLLGSCNGHHISNAAKYGVNALDEDIKEVLVNVFFDIGGAKGKGLKKKHHYERLAKQKKRQIKALKKFGATRFRSFRICADPVLYNWDSLFDYYSNVTKPMEQQKNFIKFFVEQEFMSLLKLRFMMAGTNHLNEAINFFEGRANKIHLVREKMEEVLIVQFRKFLKADAVVDVDSEGEVSKKSGKELLDVDLEDESMYLGRKSVFVGQQVTSLMKDLNLTPLSPQLDFFYTKVFQFHKTVAKKLIEYFETGLQSPELLWMSALSPSNRKKASTPKKIMDLARSYSKIINVICSGTGFDQLRNELDVYIIDDKIDDAISTHIFDEYWGEVGNLMDEGADDSTEDSWCVYEILPRFARALGTAFNSGSECERSFSVQSDVHRDIKRNRMSHLTLDSHLQIRFGIEAKSSRDKCDSCSKRKEKDVVETDAKTNKSVCDCHCDYSEIPQEMVDNCAEAWRDHLSKKGEDGMNKMPLAENVVPSEERMKRLAELRTKIKKRETFYEPDAMKPIYESAYEKKKRRLSEKAAELKLNLEKKKKKTSSHSKSKQTTVGATNMEENVEKSKTSKVQKNSSPPATSLDKYTIPKKSTTTSIATVSQKKTTKKDSDATTLIQKKTAKKDSHATSIQKKVAKENSDSADSQKKTTKKDSDATVTQKKSTKKNSDIAVSQKKTTKKDSEKEDAVSKLTKPKQKQKQKNDETSSSSSSSSSDSSSETD